MKKLFTIFLLMLVAVSAFAETNNVSPVVPGYYKVDKPGVIIGYHFFKKGNKYYVEPFWDRAAFYDADINLQEQCTRATSLLMDDGLLFIEKGVYRTKGSIIRENGQVVSFYIQFSFGDNMVTTQLKMTGDANIDYDETETPKLTDDEVAVIKQSNKEIEKQRSGEID